MENAVKIKCKWCDLADTCKNRERKEKYEDSGWITHCTETPNRLTKKKRRKKSVKSDNVTIV